MKILFVAYGYEHGGISELYTAFQLAQSVRRCGHEITVLTKDPGNEPERIHLGTRPWLANTPYGRALKLDYFEFIGHAYRKARQLRGAYDLIHHISPISFRYPDPLVALGYPFVWGPLGGSIDYPPGFGEIARRESLLQRLRKFDRARLIYDPTLRHTLKHARRIVVTSAAAREILPTQYRPKSIVIPEGYEAASPRRDTGDVPIGNYLFCSARLVPYKGVDLLLRAFAKCCTDSNTSPPLWITGDGAERRALEALSVELGIGTRVRLLGRVSKEENLRLIAGAKFCVFPALNEAFGHVNLEAMDAGKALIVTDWGGPADIVEDGITGFKVLGSDPEKHVALLSAKMAVLLQNTDLCRSMGERGRERLRQIYFWNAIGRRYDDLYRSLIR